MSNVNQKKEKEAGATRIKVGFLSIPLLDHIGRRDIHVSCTTVYAREG